MRRFRVKLVDEEGNSIATSIQVTIPDSVPLRSGIQASPMVSDAAKAYAMGRVVIELNNYALSEAILAGPGEDEYFRRRTQA